MGKIISILFSGSASFIINLYLSVSMNIWTHMYVLYIMLTELHMYLFTFNMYTYPYQEIGHWLLSCS
jgi:hypothetical protein